MSRKLKVFRNIKNRHSATINYREELYHKDMEKGPTSISYNKFNQLLEASGSRNSVLDDILNDLKPILDN